MREPLSSENLSQKIDKSISGNRSIFNLRTTVVSNSGEDNLTSIIDLFSKDYLIGQDIERKRIAQDLHDSFGQKLNAIHLHLSALEKIISDVEVSKEILSDIKLMVDESIVSLREISTNIMPSSMQIAGLKNTIIQVINRQNLIEPNLIEYDIDDLDVSFLGEQETVFVFRIIQEFLNNSIKYSKAVKIQIEIKNTKEKFQVIMQDNGIGFTRDNTKSSSGLNNIQSRLEALKAHYHFESKPKTGTYLNFILHAK